MTMPETRHTSLGAAILGALLIAALSTLGDVIWFEGGLPHRPAYGLAHGLGLCSAIGLYLGAVARRLGAGAGGGATIGLVSAGGYYLLAPLTGPAVMFFMWMVLWLMFAALVERLGGAAIRWRSVLGRGGLAALVSGLAFYAISGIWFEKPAAGRNYGVHFASWTLAYLPAFLALLYRRSGADPSAVPPRSPG